MTLKMQKRNKRPKIKYLKTGEWAKLISICDNFRDRLILKFLYLSGMRVGEFAKIKVEDIDFKERFIFVPAENTKTKQSRTVYCPTETLSELKGYLKEKKIKTGRIFDLSVRRIQQIVKTWGKKAGAGWIHPHTLRHSHIVHKLMKKTPMAAVQKQVGHKTLTTTQVYADLAPEEIREAYEKTETVS